MLNAFRRNKKDLFTRYRTMNEIWTHPCTLESNRQSVERAPSHTNSPERQKSTQEVMAPAFWDVHDIIFIDYFEKTQGSVMNLLQ